MFVGQEKHLPVLRHFSCRYTQVHNSNTISCAFLYSQKLIEMALGIRYAVISKDIILHLPIHRFIGIWPTVLNLSESLVALYLSCRIGQLQCPTGGGSLLYEVLSPLLTKALCTLVMSLEPMKRG